MKRMERTLALPASPTALKTPPLLRRFRGWAGRFLLIFLVFELLGSSGPLMPGIVQQRINIAVTPWHWDLVGWEVAALVEKLETQFTLSLDEIPPQQRPLLVKEYLGRAQLIGQRNAEILQLLSQGAAETSDDVAALQSEVDDLRSENEAIRRQVELVIQSQVGYELAKEGISLYGMPFPPVFFTFTSSPKKLVVSPRHRIATEFWSMIEPSIPNQERTALEERIMTGEGLSAYVASTGGLGAYPTLVVNEASLEWILSTVAHEWTHNYLTLHPLGINYSTSPEITALNETVAEIVGNEIGARTLASFYPELLAPPAASGSPAPATVTTEVAAEAAPSDKEREPFNFRTTMRTTRLKVDQLLAAGKVDEAERYMESQRLLFVQNGYPLRRLNQAYFAFHGSYGSSAAASSPIGPKLAALREGLSKLEAMRDGMSSLSAFLAAVRGITSEAELDRLLIDNGIPLPGAE